jgi:hypothetical protein
VKSLYPVYFSGSCCIWRSQTYIEEGAPCVSCQISYFLILAWLFNLKRLWHPCSNDKLACVWFKLRRAVVVLQVRIASLVIIDIKKGLIDTMFYRFKLLLNLLLDLKKFESITLPMVAALFLSSFITFLIIFVKVNSLRLRELRDVEIFHNLPSFNLARLVWLYNVENLLITPWVVLPLTLLVCQGKVVLSSHLLRRRWQSLVNLFFVSLADLIADLNYDFPLLSLPLFGHLPLGSLFLYLLLDFL